MAKKPNIRRTIVVRKEDEWIISVLDRIVDTKKELGVNASFSYELLRLAKNALLGTAKGVKLDKEVLRRVRSSK